MNKNAIVYVLLGQSNAVGFKLHMDKADFIKTPLKNVYGLSRKLNQTFDNNELYWQNYLSAGFNLGESNDNTYSIANCLACEWQKRIDDGQNLPDLYVVHIAVGAQGVTDGYMWNPNYPKKLVSGKLDTVDIALHTLTVNILSKIDASMQSRGVCYQVAPICWRGGENDMTADATLLQNTLYHTYVQMFSDWRKALGKNVPIVLHQIISHELADQLDPTGRYNRQREYINQIFNKLSLDLPCVSTVNPKTFPQYVEGVHTNGVFLDDCVHYTKEVNKYLAKITADELSKRPC